MISSALICFGGFGVVCAGPDWLSVWGWFSLVMLKGGGHWWRRRFAMGEFVPVYFNIIALMCTVGAIAIAIHHIYMHLVNYTEPTYQRYIVRIIFMVPVSTMKFLYINP